MKIVRRRWWDFLERWKKKKYHKIVWERVKCNRGRSGKIVVRCCTGYFCCNPLHSARRARRKCERGRSMAVQVHLVHGQYLICFLNFVILGWSHLFRSYQIDLWTKNKHQNWCRTCLVLSFLYTEQKNYLDLNNPFLVSMELEQLACNGMAPVDFEHTLFQALVNEGKHIRVIQASVPLLLTSAHRSPITFPFVVSIHRFWTRNDHNLHTTVSIRVYSWHLQTNVFEPLHLILRLFFSFCSCSPQKNNWEMQRQLRWPW